MSSSAVAGAVYVVIADDNEEEEEDVCMEFELEDISDDSMDVVVDGDGDDCNNDVDMPLVMLMTRSIATCGKTAGGSASCSSIERRAV